MKTILSAGQAVHEILRDSAEVSAITRKIFPLVQPEATLPYIAYERINLEATAVKSGRPADAATYEVRCFAEGYPESVTLAEAVREALDCIQGEAAGMCIRRSQLVDAREDALDNCFCQILTFRIQI